VDLNTKIDQFLLEASKLLVLKLMVVAKKSRKDLDNHCYNHGFYNHGFYNHG